MVMASFMEQPKPNGSGMAAGRHEGDRGEEEAPVMPMQPPPAYSLTTSSTYEAPYGSTHSARTFDTVDLEAQVGGPHEDPSFQQNPPEKSPSPSALRLRGGCCCCDCLYDLLRCLLCCCIFEAICDMCC